jgi:hypothetical protein
MFVFTEDKERQTLKSKNGKPLFYNSLTNTGAFMPASLQFLPAKK